MAGNPLNSLGNFFSGAINDAQGIGATAGQIISNPLSALGFGTNANHIIHPDQAPVGGIFAITGQANQEGFYFFDTEIPEQLPLGGVQVNALHQFPHDVPNSFNSSETNQQHIQYRTIDVFGNQPNTLEFSGTIFSIGPSVQSAEIDLATNNLTSIVPGVAVNKAGPGYGPQNLVTATQRMRLLDNFRIQGSVVIFKYDEYEWEGVITEFHPVIHHVNLVTYTLKFEILAEDVSQIHTRPSGFQAATVETNFAQYLTDFTNHISNLVQGSAYWMSFAVGQIKFLQNNSFTTDLSTFAYFSPSTGNIANVINSFSAWQTLNQWGYQTITPAQVSQTLNTQTDNSSALQATYPALQPVELPSQIAQANAQSGQYSIMSVTDVNNSSTSSASGTYQTYLQTLQLFEAAIPQFFQNMYYQFQVDMDAAKPITTLSHNSIQAQILPEITDMMTVLEFILKVAQDMWLSINDPSLNSLIMSEGYSALSRLNDLWQLFFSLLEPVNAPTITTYNPDLVLLALQYYADPDKWILIARANNLTTPTPTGLYTLAIPPDTAGQVNVGNPVSKITPTLSGQG